MSETDWRALVEAGAKFAADMTRELGPGLIVSLASRAEVLADRELEGIPRALAMAGIGTIRGNADRLARFGADGVVGLAGIYWTEGGQAAREEYLRHHATPSEITAAADAIDAAICRAASGVAPAASSCSVVTFMQIPGWLPGSIVGSPVRLKTESITIVR